MSAPQVQLAHRADLTRLDHRRDGRIPVVAGRAVVGGEFNAVAHERLRAADRIRLVIRADSDSVPTRAGLERTSQHIRLALAVKIDGLVMVGIPHLQCGRIKLHASVRSLAGLEYRAGEDIALELARRHLVRRDSASRDLDGRHTVCRELVGGDGTSDNLGRIDRISSQFIRVHRASGELVGRDGISRNVARLNLVDVEQRHGHILSDAEFGRGHGIGCNLVGRDGQCDDVPRLHRVGGEFRGGHRVGHQLFSGHAVGRELVHRDGIGLDLLGGHAIYCEMLRSHRASSEDVVRHEVEWLESRTVPCQDFHHTISERDKHGGAVVWRALPVGVEVGKQ